MSQDPSEHNSPLSFVDVQEWVLYEKFATCYDKSYVFIQSPVGYSSSPVAKAKFLVDNRIIVSIEQRLRISGVGYSLVGSPSGAAIEIVSIEIENNAPVGARYGKTARLESRFMLDDTANFCDELRKFIDMNFVKGQPLDGIDVIWEGL